MADKKQKNSSSLTGNLSTPISGNNAMKIDPALMAQMPQNLPQMPQLDYEKLKNKLEGFRKALVKKYKFTMAAIIIPPQMAPLFEEDEQVPIEISNTHPINLMIVIPEEQYKNIPKIKPEIVKMLKESGENIWFYIKTPVDLWNYGLDSKFDFLDSVATGFPIYDNGFMGALRVASIHKSLVLRKFEKYVASYVIAGSLVRGTAGKDSDVDVFVVIDDTDVKRMPRVELLEKLRGIILDYVREATTLAGVKNVLNVQVYLLTDFWQSVKDAHPVMFTFIRDGIPLHDRGTFIPWKLLLLTGRIKPSPEAIDLYMKQGEQTEDMVKRRLLDAMVDIYYGILTPTQAMMMLAGEAPPIPKTAVQEVRKILVEKEKVMTEADLKILEKAVYLFKQYEYGKLKEYPGKDIDIFMKECIDFNKRLKEIRKKIEKKMQEKSAEDIYGEVFKLLKTFFGNKSQGELIKDFETKMIRKGKVSPRFSAILKRLVNTKDKIKSGKLDQKEADSVKKDAIELIDCLVEYAQRADLVSTDKSAMHISYGNRRGELLLLGNENFIVEGKSIKKIHNNKLVDSNKEELDKALQESKGRLSTKVSGEIFHILEKELGKFEITF